MKEKHPAAGEYISSNELTDFYYPKLSFSNEFDDYKVIFAQPKNGNKPAYIIMKGDIPVYDSDNMEAIAVRLDIYKRIKDN